MSATGQTAVDRGRRALGRAAYAAVVGGLFLGVALPMLDQDALATRVLKVTCAVLISLPIVNVVAVLLEEVHRRDWGFAWLAAGVLGLLTYSIVDRMGIW